MEMPRCLKQKLLFVLICCIFVVFLYQKFILNAEKTSPLHRKELSRTYRRDHENIRKFSYNIPNESYLSVRRQNLPNVVGKMIRNDIFEDNGEIRHNEFNNQAFNTIKYHQNFPKPLIHNISYVVENVFVNTGQQNNTTEFSSQLTTQHSVISSEVELSGIDIGRTNDTSAMTNGTTLAGLDFNVFKSSGNDLMTFSDISCNPVYPKVLLYNRIFKTGSTSISAYIKEVLNGSDIAFYEGTTESWYDSNDSYPYPELIEYLASKNDSSVFNAHFYFRKNLHIDKSFTYINILRHPVARVISHYQYMRNPNLRTKNRIEELKLSGLWDETILDCVRKQHRGCEDNVMTRILCGTKSYCKKGTKKALKRAKFNLHRYYAAVGIYEKLDLTLTIFERRLPRFFKVRENRTVVLPRSKVNTFKREFNSTVRDVILKRNKADMRLYKYATKIFNTQLRVCGL